MSQNTELKINDNVIRTAARMHGTPLYLYDEAAIVGRCEEALGFHAPYGLRVRYALKANSNKAIVQLIASRGVDFDAGSLREVQRAVLAGIDPSHIMLTSQDVPTGADFAELTALISRGLVYCACSLRQLQNIAPIAVQESSPIFLRIHLPTGSGESDSRTTGGAYAPFGIFKDDLQEALRIADGHGLDILGLHAHTGSGGDPARWPNHIETLLEAARDLFPTVRVLNLGGGFKVARMRHETSADLTTLGGAAARLFEAFFHETGRKMKIEIEPGAYIIASCGVLITRVIDVKKTGENTFLIADGGMTANSRPALYGSTHDIQIVTDGANGEAMNADRPECPQILCGPCCETGDSQCINIERNVVPRRMKEGQAGDLAVIGGCGAYCASMSLSNYNSHLQIPEVLIRMDGTLQLIRARQTLAQMVQNERDL